jgi:hypothetical protein
MSTMQIEKPNVNKGIETIKSSMYDTLNEDLPKFLSQFKFNNIELDKLYNLEKSLSTYFNHIMFSIYGGSADHSIFPLQFKPIYLVKDGKKYLFCIHSGDYTFYGHYKSSDADFKMLSRNWIALYPKVKDICVEISQVMDSMNITIESEAENINEIVYGLIHYTNSTPSGIYSAISFETMRLVREIMAEVKSKVIIGINSKVTGSKMIPLMPLDIKNKLNILYAPWREMYILNMMNRAKFNNIAACFPITYEAFINQYDNKLFMNSSIIEKVKSSEIINEYKKYAKLAVSDLLAEFSEGKIKAPIKRLVQSTYERAESTLYENTITNEVLCLLMESPGYSIESIALAFNDPFFHFSEHYDIFNDQEHMKKILFQTFYGMLVLHDKFDIIHGDVHTNNLLIKIVESKNISDYDKTLKEIYFVGDSIYIIPAYIHYTQIIDYGRSLLGDTHKDLFIRQNGIVATEGYYSAQVEKMFLLLEYYLDEHISDFRDELITMMDTNREDAFRIAAYTDYLGVINSMIDATKTLRTASDTLTFLIDLNKDVTTHINQIIYDFVHKSDYALPSEYTLFNNIFAKYYRVDTSNDDWIEENNKKIVSINDSRNSLKFNLYGEMNIMHKIILKNRSNIILEDINIINRINNSKI